jgi:transcriptional regulator with XRE-family HTH domain
MTANTRNPAATHLGRQKRRDRTAHGWSLRAFAARTGVIYSTLSQIETGKRPFSEKMAIICDEQFPEKRGWYLTYYDESRDWTTPGFRDWAEHEDRATVIRAWSPGMIHGPLETDDYARFLLSTLPGATPEIINARVANRMKRQQRLLFGPEPPLSYFVLDELSLYRCVGSPETMVKQMGLLVEVARLPHVTMQILPARQHPANASEFIVTDSAAYVEHLMGGLVYTEPESVGALTRLFHTIESESYRASESLVRLERLGEIWAGVRAVTAAPRVDPA